MITCLFSCADCGLTDCSVRVRAKSANELLDKWFYGTVLDAVAFRHVLLSPVCNSRKPFFVKVPFCPEPEAWIGKQTDAIPPKGITG